jgi:putative NADH-flavin reductase
MKVALIGASGFVGSAILDEAVSRGYQITAIARNTDKVKKDAGVTAVSADVNNVEALAAALTGHDAVISSFNPGWADANLHDNFIKGSEAIQEAVKRSGVKRLLVIGGAGSLEVAPGLQLVDTPEFPAEWKTGANAAREYLNILRKEEELDWTFLSPAINLHPGQRTGVFRLGTDNPVFDENGKNEITVADLAVAALNELENNQYIKARFTLGY